MWTVQLTKWQLDRYFFFFPSAVSVFPCHHSTNHHTHSSVHKWHYIILAVDSMIKYQTKKIRVHLVTTSAFFLGSYPTLRTTGGELNNTLLHSYTHVCGNVWSYRKGLFSPNSLVHSSYHSHNTSCKQFCSILPVGPQCIQFQISVLHHILDWYR